MARQIDRYRRQAQITNNPLNTITAGNLAKVIAQPPPNAAQILEEGLEEAITNVLKWIDSGTGLNLVGWAQTLEAELSAGMTAGEDLLTAYNNYLQGALSSLKTNSDASKAALATFLQAVDTAVTGYTNFSTFIAAVESAWSTYSTTESGLISSDVFTIKNFFNSLLGLNTTTGQISGNNVASSTGLASLQADWTQVVNFWDNLFGVGNDPTTSQVQGTTVTGAGGTLNIVTAVESVIDQLVQAFTKTSTTGNGLGQLANAASGTAAQAAYAQEVAQAATAVQAQQATAKPGYMAIDSTMDAVFPLSHMLVAPTYLSVTAAATAMGYICVPDNVAKLSVAWVGSYTGTLSGLYINIYSMNASTGALTKVEASSSIIGSVGTASSWNYYDLPTAITANVGDWYAVEMVVTGSGTYSLMGVPASAVPQNNVVYPKALGASRPVAPAYDAAGTGSFSASNTTTFTWSHALGSTASAVLVEFALINGGGPPSVSSVTVGGVAATVLASKTFNGGIEVAYLYGLLNPPTGTQSITVTLGGSAYLAGNSISYNGVSSFGTPVTNSGTSSGTASLSVSSAVGQVVTAAVFGSNGLSAFNQTSRWTGGTSSVGSYGIGGDAPGASTVSFTATVSGSAWATLGVPLSGQAAAAPSTVSSPAYTNNVPWFGLGTSAVDNHPVYAPEPHSYYTNGSYTLAVPSWAVYADVIALGAGGGAGGGVNGAGSNGGNTTITVGTHTVTGTGGLAGAGGTTTTPNDYGMGPGNETYNGTTYYGGTEVGLGNPGSSPGGGGGGSYYAGLVGHAGGPGSYSANTYTLTGITSIAISVGAGGLENNIGGSPSYGAAPGADGAAWIVFRQS